MERVFIRCSRLEERPVGRRWTPDGRYTSFWLGPNLAGGYGADIWAIRETKSFFGKIDREPIQLTLDHWDSSPSPSLARTGREFSPRVTYRTANWRGTMSPLNIGLPFLSASRHLTWTSPGMGSGLPTSPTRRDRFWRSRADGSQRLQLASPEIRIRMPRWSPDGKQIAFTGKVSGQPYQLYVVSAEGGERGNHWSRGNCDDIEPMWSPDGNSLAFDSDREHRAK